MLIIIGVKFEGGEKLTRIETITNKNAVNFHLFEGNIRTFERNE